MWAALLVIYQASGGGWDGSAVLVWTELVYALLVARLLQAIIDGLRDSVAEFTGEPGATRTVELAGTFCTPGARATDGSSAWFKCLRAQP